MGCGRGWRVEKHSTPSFVLPLPAQIRGFALYCDVGDGLRVSLDKGVIANHMAALMPQSSLLPQPTGAAASSAALLPPGYLAHRRYLLAPAALEVGAAGWAAPTPQGLHPTPALPRRSAPSSTTRASLPVPSSSASCGGRSGTTGRRSSPPPSPRQSPRGLWPGSTPPRPPPCSEPTRPSTTTRSRSSSVRAGREGPQSRAE